MGFYIHPNHPKPKTMCEQVQADVFVSPGTKEVILPQQVADWKPVHSADFHFKLAKKSINTRLSSLSSWQEGNTCIRNVSCDRSRINLNLQVSLLKLGRSTTTFTMEILQASALWAVLGWTLFTTCNWFTPDTFVWGTIYDTNWLDFPWWWWWWWWWWWDIVCLNMGYTLICQRVGDWGV